MFSTIVALLPFALAAAALPQDGGHNGQCTTGTLSCCDNVQDTTNAADPLGQLGLGHLLDGITGQVGLQCTPITGIGLGQSANCKQQPVCCDHNNFNGLLNLGCSPININL
ncbi:hydrophobin [Coniophora puteana RWD-64-598 SS2]|uniref:Hydrophobin n=1 Tax=Coniophora puteana (strain RWD-64-598) TaxID=741705 RepID=A0A5M3MFL6_CONPW|nr:hydrophobin [Coniophora puteana RWD-64-598 SS2]EIW77381.1 hydrophobin [Coniophora puteana RWD-64-598 SS2]